jgi:hypothetical protein
MKHTLILAIVAGFPFMAFSQNQSSMKTTNQKNVNVQKKNDEAGTGRIRSKTTQATGNDRRHKNDSTHRPARDSMNR